MVHVKLNWTMSFPLPQESQRLTRTGLSAEQDTLAKKKRSVAQKATANITSNNPL